MKFFLALSVAVALLVTSVTAKNSYVVKEKKNV